MKTLSISLLLMLLFASCSKHVNYSNAHIKQTSGRYLFSDDEVIDVFYDANVLYIKWKEGKIKPVVLDEQTFFVPDMYKKLRFVQDPETKKRYLGIVSEADDNKVDLAYEKVADTFKTPRMYLNTKDYQKAKNGYLELRKQDSTKVYIEEGVVNRMGYALLRDKKFDDAIAVLEMNVALFPESDNVYDSLADAYLRKGDSLQAFTNYKKAYELNTGNKRAKEFLDIYRK